MQQQNPELVEQLRRQFQQNNPPEGDGQKPCNSRFRESAVQNVVPHSGQTVLANFTPDHFHKMHFSALPTC